MFGFFFSKRINCSQQNTGEKKKTMRNTPYTGYIDGLTYRCNLIIRIPDISVDLPIVVILSSNPHSIFLTFVIYKTSMIKNIIKSTLECIRM